MLMALQPSKGAVYKQLANGHVVFSLKSFLFIFCFFVIFISPLCKKVGCGSKVGSLAYLPYPVNCKG